MEAPKYFYSDGTEYTREDYYVKNNSRMNKVRKWLNIGLVFGTACSALVWAVNNTAQVMRILSLFMVVTVGPKLGINVSDETLNNVIGNIWAFLLFIFLIVIFVISFKGYYHMDKKMFDSLIYIYLGMLFSTVIALIATGSMTCVFFFIYSIAGILMSWQNRRCISELEELSLYEGFPYFSPLIDCKSASKYYKAIATRFTPTAKEGKAVETEEEKERKKKRKAFTPTNEYYAEQLTEKRGSGEMDAIPITDIVEEAAE